VKSDGIDELADEAAASGDDRRKQVTDDVTAKNEWPRSSARDLAGRCTTPALRVRLERGREVRSTGWSLRKEVTVHLLQG